MDLLNDGSNKENVLMAQRIATGKQNLEFDNFNTTTLCASLEPPDIRTYLTALQGYGWILWTGCALLVTIIAVVCTITLRAAARHRAYTNLVFVIALYPAVACATYVWLVVPRSGPLAEALAQFAVMMAMYRLQRVIITDCGGEDELVNRAAKARLETRLPPCCCLPCCVIPRPEISRCILNRLRLMVLQMPIVQTLVYIALLILWAENQNLYHDNYNYFVPVIIASILTGIWGMTMTVRAAETVGVRSKAKFLTVQLTLIVVKLQGGVFKAAPKMLNMPCYPPLTPPVYMNLTNNALSILEMMLLAIWTWRLYKIPPTKLFDKIQHVKVIKPLENSLTLTLEGKNCDKGMENKSFSSENSTH